MVRKCPCGQQLFRLLNEVSKIRLTHLHKLAIIVPENNMAQEKYGYSNIGGIITAYPGIRK